MVSTNNLQIGNAYSLRYKSPWQAYDVVDVQVVSLTTDSESQLFSSDSMFSEFFAAYGLGVSSYVASMAAMPDIYVCQHVKSRNPINIDKPLILIPKAVIDFSATINLLQIDSVNVNIDGLMAYHALAYDRGIYYENMVSNVKLAIRNLVEFGDSNVAVRTTSTDILVPEEDFNAFEAFRTASYDTAQLAETYDKAQKTRDFRNYLLAYDGVRKTQLELDTKIAAVQAQHDTLAVSMAAYTQNVKDVHTARVDVFKLFNGLDDGSIIVGDSMYNSLKTKLQTFMVQE